MLNNKTLFSVTGLMAAAALLIVVNILSTYVFKSFRIDLTDNKLYTLSDGTKNILGEIDEQITVRFYFSEKVLVGIPNIMNYGRRVKELLEEYATISGNKLKLIVNDPEPFSEHEDQAVQYGLQGVPIDAAGTLAYFGLVGTNATDDQEVISFFQPEKEQSLEYDITKLIHKLQNPKKRVVGLITTLPMKGEPQNPMMARRPDAKEDWYILNQIRQLFELRELDIEIETVPSDIDVLMIVHPKELTDKTLYAIDQFVLNGGRAMVFVDAFSEAEVPDMDPQNPMASMNAARNSTLGSIFDAWGVQILTDKIATDRQTATQVNVNMSGRPQAIDYVAWLTLKEENFNSDDFITGELKTVTMATSGILIKKEDAETEFTPIIETSAEAMEIQKTQIQFGPNPAMLLRNYQPGSQKLVLAARISGNVKTAFPDGAPKGEDDEESTKLGETVKESPIKESKEPINVIVIADTDMLSDRFWVNVQNFFGRKIAIPKANNDSLIVNAIENLSGSNDLISLRSRGKSARPFHKVIALKKEAEQRLQEKEKALQEKLDETNQKLNELQQRKDGGNAQILSAEQRRELDRFRNQQVQTRKELRSVRHDLGKDIEKLGTLLKFINIGLVPLIIIVIATGFGIFRHRRMQIKIAATT